MLWILMTCFAINYTQPHLTGCPWGRVLFSMPTYVKVGKHSTTGINRILSQNDPLFWHARNRMGTLVIISRSCRSFALYKFVSSLWTLAVFSLICLHSLLSVLQAPAFHEHLLQVIVANSESFVFCVAILVRCQTWRKHWMFSAYLSKIRWK